MKTYPSDRACYCGRAVEFVVTTFGMKSTLEALIDGINDQIARPTPGHPTNEQYLKVLRDDLQRTLKNYENRYGDEREDG